MFIGCYFISRSNSDPKIGNEEYFENMSAMLKLDYS